VAKTTQQRRVEDRLGELIEPLIPSRPAPHGPDGRPGIDDRAALEGILFVLDTGCRWRDLPEQLGCGSGHAAWRRLPERQAAGGSDRLHHLVLDELSDIDELDWTRGCIDAVSVRLKRGAS
jgi:transposase